MKTLSRIALFALLAACGDAPGPLSLYKLRGYPMGQFDLAPNASESATFVATWFSSRGEQSVFASLAAPKSFLMVRTTLSLTLPSGEVLSATDDGSDVPVMGLASCSQGRCLMRAVGTVTYERMQDATDAMSEKLDWQVLLDVSPTGSAKTTDLSIEILDRDAGTN